MNHKEIKGSMYKKITIGILISLIITNIIWLATSKYPGSFIGVLFYGVMTFIFWRKSHFQAGIIGGIMGLVVHIYELIFNNITKLGLLDSGFFFINLILPLPLIYFSYKTYKESKYRNDKPNS